MSQNVRGEVDAKEAFDRYETGMTLEQVANELGVTRESIRQALVANGLPIRTVAETRAIRRAKLIRDEGERIREMFAKCRDIDEVVETLDLPRSVVTEVVESSFSKRERRTLRPTTQKYSDEELHSFLEQASAKLGGVLTANGYTQFARGRSTPDGRPWPTHQTFALRFGTWRAALLSNGLAANPSSPIAGQSIFEDGHCIDALRAAAREVGMPLTTNAYDEFAKASNGALPSLATVRHKLGRWNEALTKAGL